MIIKGFFDIWKQHGLRGNLGAFNWMKSVFRLIAGDGKI